MRINRYLILMFISFSLSVYGKVDNLGKDLRFWVKTIDSKQGPQEMLGWERLVQTPFSTYKVAELTYFSYPFENKIEESDVKSLLQNQFKLGGLSVSRVGEAFRFEGYQKDLRRQVVIYVSKNKGNIIATSAFYRPMYGRKLGLEVEIWHRLLHNEDFKARFSFFKYVPHILDKIIPSAHAQIECSKCAGNPACLVFCRSANGTSGGSGSGGVPSVGLPSGGGSSAGGGLFNFGAMDMNALSDQLTNVNGQLNVLNGNVSTSNVNWEQSNSNWQGTNSQISTANQNFANTNTELNVANQNFANTNTELNVANQNFANTNTQLNSANQNWSNSNDQLNSANQNWSNSNNQLDTANQNFANTNDQLSNANKNFENLNKIVDQRSAEATQTMKNESEAWRNMMDKQSTRALDITEKMTEPKHLFKMAAASAAGAVIGATAVNLAINGVKQIVGFLAKWANGDLKKMNQDEMLKEFEQAMKIYSQSEPLAKNLEAQIDQTLASLTLYKKFQLDNVDVLPNLQKAIIETEFKIEDAKEKRCADDLVGLNKELVEYLSLAKILSDSDPLQKICSDLKNSFQKLSEAEGLLQNARPNLLKAEEILNLRKAQAQNDASREMDKLKKNKMSNKVSRAQQKQRQILHDKNIKDSELLINDIQKDCRTSFKKALKKHHATHDMKLYCDKILYLSSNNDEILSSLQKSFPEMDKSDHLNVFKQFSAKHIPIGLAKYRKYEGEREDLFKGFDIEVARHKTEVLDLKDRLDLDPEIALSEISSINKFIEKIMNEQATLFTKGLRDREAKIDEACMGINNQFEVKPESKKQLEKALKTIDELEGSTVGNTIINCDPGMLRIECAEKLQTLSNVLKNKESKVPRIVITPEMGMDSVLFKDKSNPNLDYLKISSRLGQDKISSILERRNERFP